MAPKTGVLQGSILSPYLYSVYTNQLPVYLRPQTIKEDTSPLQLAPLLNCLLYEDDVVLIANSSTMVDLLRKCEEHKYAIYDQVIPQATTFNYLGIPFKQGGHLDAEKLVQNNILKAMPTMDALSSIGLKTLEEAQNKCIRKIYGASEKISTKVMLHLAKLPTMKERIVILQAQFLFRSLSLPEGTLLYFLMPHIHYTRDHQWYRLSKTVLWRLMPPTIADLDVRGFRAIKKKFLHSNLEKQIQVKNSKLLSSCRPTITLDLLLWLPMAHEKRNRCLRWRLGCLPGEAPKPCPRHPSNNLSRRHAISCLNTHPRLCMPETIADPISFFLNMLPTHAFVPSIIALSWTWRWPVICTILHELDQLQHYTTIPCKTPHGQKLIEWLRQFN
ncbi:hypothetical protein G6F29_009848 [Rhizopus arrhizus]|uniref:Reverse transcriptase domain-containing protein n=1 Tax=Rhizopus oryzae TaxID=64495 RepID=A0A9P6X3Z5_RHIOR|nr:hypothetical protein G6F24_010805 [Rhizopus arrhizus]KAG0777546.1 hypothetical protein G6F22_011799 [Rhizopus arrhizus]KAG0785914.1 hypothetical protein G6F21_008950 [Rhizopus arrhizus]KAG0808635.1 hypothetical protein G6F20_009419 [Rhizopus arrhizus]KAG0825942.1 hypothetical protein G6F19_009546 [Rhizopus arrhizus]